MALAKLISNQTFRTTTTFQVRSAECIRFYHAVRPCPKRSNILTFSLTPKTINVRSQNLSSGRGKAAYRGGPFSWRNLGVAGIVLGVLFLGGIYYKQQKEAELERQRRRAIGKAAIGGKFELTDHNGKKRHSDEFLGSWVLIYFGFTHCPDICPEELEKMCKVVKLLEDSPIGPKVVPLFISVDPERDTVEAVRGYIKEFSDKLIGLTGTKEEIADVTKRYRVYYSAGPRDGTSDYIVDHTIIMYLMNPNGEFVDYYGQLKTAEQIANAITIQNTKFEAEKKPKGFFS